MCLKAIKKTNFSLFYEQALGKNVVLELLIESVKLDCMNKHEGFYVLQHLAVEVSQIHPDFRHHQMREMLKSGILLPPEKTVFLQQLKQVEPA